MIKTMQWRSSNFRTALVLAGLGVSTCLVGDAIAWAESGSSCERWSRQDLATRRALPQTNIATSDWKSCCGSWGPRPRLFPGLPTDSPCQTPKELRDRVVLTAKSWEGLPYLHRHIPALGGLDCSNFTTWVYDFGFGILLNSNVSRQSKSAGRKLLPNEELLPGDLLFIWNRDRKEVGHVAIYVDSKTLIDSTGDRVSTRSFSGWYRDRLAWARRVIE